jgi:hypothetical protein
VDADLASARRAPVMIVAVVVLAVLAVAARPWRVSLTEVLPPGCSMAGGSARSYRADRSSR